MQYNWQYIGKTNPCCTSRCNCQLELLSIGRHLFNCNWQLNLNFPTTHAIQCGVTFLDCQIEINNFIYFTQRNVLSNNSPEVFSSPSSHNMYMKIPMPQGSLKVALTRLDNNNCNELSIKSNNKKPNYSCIVTTSNK